MVSLAALFQALRENDGLLATCSHHQLDFFIHLGRHFRAEIELHSAIKSAHPPHILPRYLIIFLSGVLSPDTSVLTQLWDALKGFIWAYRDNHGVFEAAQLSPDEKKAINYTGGRPT